MDSTQATHLEPARLPRRLLGLALDVGLMALPVCAMLLTGTLSRKALSPEPGWFYSEWLLKLWLDHPPYIVAPILWWIIFSLVWQLGWELSLGRTPGAMLAGVSPRDRRNGHPISKIQALLRTLGACLNLLTLGLGYALCFIFRDGTALHELLSHTVTARHKKRNPTQ